MRESADGGSGEEMSLLEIKNEVDAPPSEGRRGDTVTGFGAELIPSRYYCASNANINTNTWLMNFLVRWSDALINLKLLIATVDRIARRRSRCL